MKVEMWDIERVRPYAGNPRVNDDAIEPVLPLELAALKDMNYDLDLLGFDEDELAKLLGPGVQDGLCDPDEVPEPPDEAITQPGDLWILGDYRLLCGDSAKAEDVDRLLDGAKIQLVSTDPPYNVKVEPRSNNAIAAGLSSFQATHHQGLDLARHPEKSKPTHKKLRAKDRPLVNDFVSEEEFDRLLQRLVWQHGARIGAGPRILHLGRVRESWQLSTGAQGPRPLFFASDHLG